jgi:hypothetical protein
MSAMPAIPDWLPGWVPALLVSAAALYALVLLAMPFSVFGLKGRLDDIEGQLDEISARLDDIQMALRAGAGPEHPPARAPEPAPPQVEAATPPMPPRLSRREPRLGPPP